MTTQLQAKSRMVVSAKVTRANGKVEYYKNLTEKPSLFKRIILWVRTTLALVKG